MIFTHKRRTFVYFTYFLHVFYRIFVFYFVPYYHRDRYYSCLRKDAFHLHESYTRVKQAEKGIIVSLLVYVFLSALKIFIGIRWTSSALRADGLNNLTDAASSITVLIGLRTARKPADEDHRYGHWKAEPIASLITSLIMLTVGVQVVFTSGKIILSTEFSVPNPLTGLVALFSGLVLFILYRGNAILAKKLKSSGLKAVSRDNLADALTSFVTGFAIFASMIGLDWVDGYMAFLVGVIILKTGYDVFVESAFSLSDGFDIEEIRTYTKATLSIPGVKEVKAIKGRMYGPNVYLDVTILVDGSLTVQEGHDITQEVEDHLYHQYGVLDIDVHVEPVSLHRPTQ